MIGTAIELVMELARGGLYISHMVKLTFATPDTVFEYKLKPGASQVEVEVSYGYTLSRFVVVICPTHVPSLAFLLRLPLLITCTQVLEPPNNPVLV
jgi:hypothetical protein